MLCKCNIAGQGYTATKSSDIRLQCCAAETAIIQLLWSQRNATGFDIAALHVACLCVALAHIHENHLLIWCAQCERLSIIFFLVSKFVGLITGTRNFQQNTWRLIQMHPLSFVQQDTLQMPHHILNFALVTDDTIHEGYFKTVCRNTPF